MQYFRNRTKNMQQADIGLIGLGVMGANLALNIAENGYRIAVYNRTPAKTQEFYAGAGSLQDNIVTCQSLEELAANIRAPRPIILMVKAGEAVDEQIAALKPYLEKNDIIIDAGNANFHDTVRRLAELGSGDPTFVGMGVSGGEEGARHGPSIMVGGTPESYARIEPVLTAISAKFEGEPCSALMGPDGAGHFVKTIHNGIEYADMQMIAEVYGVLRDGLQLAPDAIGKIFETWNKGPLNSYLIEITAKVLLATDKQTGKPAVDVILDSAGQKGTGRWAAIEAQMLGIPATGIEAAVAARSISSLVEQRSVAAKAYGDLGTARLADKSQGFIDALERGLLAGKIAAYAQGFEVMAGASKERGWDIPLATTARIWRAGCIIRSQFLDEIAAAFEGNADTNLLLVPAFVERMKEGSKSLRKIVAEASLAGLPVPALSAALNYFDGFRQARGTANLIQAQRDFFGAHGFKRLDLEGDFHGPWSSAG
ncbi:MULTISPECIES: NADP-dependent phosphogluconate dehydrogenase [unclassified Phyllobacterium]|uniref:NADP-dependent phosphogluconate dehydrogenase n=1 Tax=unclassified Phyllobacterium TaxID=2638441 RepID=UPI002B2746CE|nr:MULTISPECIES: NADP-dependent phosphogluconate dehydrogenase [unclassified Phyllobacterium]